MSALSEAWLAAGVITQAQADEIDRVLAREPGAARNELLGVVATAALVAVATSDTAPAGARAQAGRTLAEMSGALVKAAPKPPNKPVSEMSLAEIEARIATLGGVYGGDVV